MLSAVVWGLIQGLTEFLPVSSSGHLVIIPAFLSELGVEVSTPDLAVSAVLHLGTLVAVLVYFRRDVAKMLRFGSDPEGRRLGTLVLIGSVPALIGLPLEAAVDEFQSDVVKVAWALVGTGVILAVGHRLARGSRTLDRARIPDAVVIGVAQAVALIPGVSRSGITITAGKARRFAPAEAARFSFVLGIPAIAGAGILELPRLADAGGVHWELAVGFVISAVAGYLAIALLLSVIGKVGLLPFSVYCLLVGLAALVVL